VVSGPDGGLPKFHQAVVAQLEAMSFPLVSCQCACSRRATAISSQMRSMLGRDAPFFFFLHAQAVERRTLKFPRRRITPTDGAHSAERVVEFSHLDYTGKDDVLQP
jgi:hypothetical protein